MLTMNFHYPWSKVAGGTTGDYIADSYGSVKSGHVFESVTNLDLLSIEIHSEPQQLGTVMTGGDGSFVLETILPEELKPGTHKIVVLYQGKEIANQELQVGPKAADSFIEALTVGFNGENKGLLPGLAILIGLLAIGLITLFVKELRQVRSIKQ